MFRWFLILAVTVCCIAGCGGSTGDLGAGALVDAGTFRALKNSDTWNYYLVWVHNGATYSDRTATVAISTVGSDLIYTLTVNFGVEYATQTFKFRFTQAGDGTLTIDGIQAIDQAAIEDAAPPVTSPAADAYATNDLTGTTVFDGRNLAIDLANVGTENVDAADGNTYRCYKYDGTVDEDGNVMNFTLWINPSIGNVVKLVYAYNVDVGGNVALLTATMLLRGKSLH